MKLNILIGGKAGQGINTISEIVSEILVKQGYFVFNYRDYPSLIRGGHNFNILSISESNIGSSETLLDGIIALDENTIKVHKKNLKNTGFIVDNKGLEHVGMNLNLALAGSLTKILGINKEILITQVQERFNNKEVLSAVEKGFESQKKLFDLTKQKNTITLMSGSTAVAQGAINSHMSLYLAYPMTPATGVMHDLAAHQLEKNVMVFQPESEISVINMALGASFAGAKVMVGTSGGGFDLMTEGLSLQGQTEVPLVVYLASRPGPGTGLPTYSCQADLDIALRGGHGEFPRVVIAPGDPKECIEKTNEAFYLSQKFNALSILLSDKHLAESEFSFSGKPHPALQSKATRIFPGKTIVKVNGYEHDEKGNTTEDADIATTNAEKRLAKYNAIKTECKKFEMIKIHGKKNSKKLIVSWGSTKTVILDAIKDLDYKFLQVLYMKPLSDKLKEELEKAQTIILVEQNMTGQLGRLIREKTGIAIKNRILKTDGRPFTSDALQKEILKL